MWVGMNKNWVGMNKCRVGNLDESVFWFSFSNYSYYFINKYHNSFKLLKIIYSIMQNNWKNIIILIFCFTFAVWLIKIIKNQIILFNK